MKLISSFRFWIIVLLPLVISLLLFFIIRKPSINLLTNQDFELKEFSDIADKGNSLCKITNNKSFCTINFTLRNGYAFPYAGIQINKTNYSLFDLSDYTFSIKIDAEQDVRMSLRQNQFIPGYSKMNNPLTMIVYLKSFGFKKGMNELEIQSKDINEIPEWWFTMNPEKVNDVKNLTLDKTQIIWLFSESSIKRNTPISLTIHEFKLQYNSQPLLIILSICILLYYLVLVLLWKFKKSSIQYIFMPLEQLKISDKNPQTQTDIVLYIAKNYNNPNLKLSDIAKDLQLSEDTISFIIKKYSNKNFRQYLNHLRMEEAKRLLKETSLNVSEIAFAVGYNNIQHFNRVFKEYTLLSPKSFREE